MTPVRIVHKKTFVTAGKLNSAAHGVITYFMEILRVTIVIRGIYKEEL